MLVVPLLLLATTPGASLRDTLTDADITAYAARPLGEAEKAAKVGTVEVLGIHHGVRVVALYPCADQCPAGVVRLIAYDVSSDEACAAAGGRVKYAPAPQSGEGRPYCVPGPLAWPFGRPAPPMRGDPMEPGGSRPHD